MSNLTRIFIYGTLKKGFSNSSLLNSSEYLGEDITVQRYPIFIDPSFGFPYLLSEEGRGKFIKGEVYDVTDDTLKAMDIFEGSPDLYKRGTIELKEFGEVQVFYETSAPCVEQDLIDFDKEKGDNYEFSEI
jgi:gamma-glutamylcyclotransferase (GGCT)/AIG2-like uncharacterized protein YtfP